MLDTEIDNEGNPLKSGELGKKDYPLNVRLEPWQEFYLAKMCKDLGHGRSQLIRHLIEKQAKKLYGKKRKTNVLHYWRSRIQGFLNQPGKLASKIFNNGN